MTSNKKLQKKQMTLSRYEFLFSIWILNEIELRRQ
jgi:hypothetical protein